MTSLSSSSPRRLFTALFLFSLPVLVLVVPLRAQVVQMPCTAGGPPPPAAGVGPATVSPSYSAETSSGGPNAPPCSPILNGGVPALNGQTAGPSANPAAARARQAQLAKLQKQIDNDTAQLVQLAQELRATTAAQRNNAVLSVDALKQAQLIAKLAKEVQKSLKLEAQ